MEIAHSLQQIKSSYIREILIAAADKNIISLAGGLPDAKTFPLDLMKATFKKLTDMPEVFQYDATIGYAPLLKYLSHYYQLAPTHIAMICTGSQQGLDLIARAYINPNDCIIMEAPSYLGAMQVFGLVQANIQTISTTHDGPNVSELEDAFIKHNPKMFYGVPDFHNPTGICWSLETRQQVAKLCIQYDVTFIEDAPYRELRFTGEPLPMVSHFCADNAIVLRSFSKIASPGLRIAAVTAKKSYLEPLLKIKQGADLHSSVPIQALLLDLLQHPDFPEHIKTIQSLYKKRYHVLFSELKKQLPEGCELKPVDGGMFIWLSLPPCDTFALAKTLIKNGVAVVPSPVFYPHPENTPSALRLNFTNANSSELREAVSRLCRVLNATLISTQ
ncbi:putative aminotransferase [Psychromonas sp. CNPT3]|uniref:aminotransferase-like domain-containing protein n=1 Tax=Psychromonas sp. CNPT3 TaxID=314282 RepID=UPI00006E8A96|nr:PLP-dependent aminotransferase family protein [Psychromonas sp. CNPT3]AGH80516.1 putative aminotransferase [Psychromonas sp. CNPT3]